MAPFIFVKAIKKICGRKWVKNMNNITIEEVKDILKCSIDKTTNMNEAIERSLQHIYLKGYKDGQHDTSWIPVSERLPEKGEYGKVLVTYIPSGGALWTTVIITHYSDLMGIAKLSFHIGEVGKESFQNITKQVIAWIPLQEPYKAESEK